MGKTQEPTTRSFLDTDMYKLTMGQWVYHQHPDVEVVYRSKNRTRGVNLADSVDEGDLRTELDRIQVLRPTTAELDYLAAQRINGNERLFKDDYLKFLSKITLPGYDIIREDGDLVIETRGPWARGIYWETPALATENTLHYRTLKRNMSKAELEALLVERDKRLDYKTRVLEANPGVLFMEFGTRRRESFENQEYVMRKLMERVPNQMVGTSNVYLAMSLGLEPKGTEAHERYMVRAAMMADADEGLRASHNLAIEEWSAEYGPALGVALTDTFGTDFFFNDLSQKQAENLIGLRQDSGNPWGFKKRQIEFYKSRDIDPTRKLFVPSDGLDVDKLASLYHTNPGQIGQVGGWGTNLTNDLGFKPLSLVMKAVEANGNRTVKLSDNPAKATGTPENIARYQRVFGYDPTKYVEEECRY